MTTVTTDELQAAHTVMQEHLPAAGDPDYCRVCVWIEYPCHIRMVARERLIEAGHLVPESPAKRRRAARGHLPPD